MSMGGGGEEDDFTPLGGASREARKDECDDALKVGANNAEVFQSAVSNQLLRRNNEGN